MFGTRPTAERTRSTSSISSFPSLSFRVSLTPRSVSSEAWTAVAVRIFIFRFL